MTIDPRSIGRCLIAAAMAVAAWAGTAGAQNLNVATSGGAYQEAVKKAWIKPAEQELGITIKLDTTNGLTDLTAQVKAGAISWDIVELGGLECIYAHRAGLLEPLDYTVIDASDLPPDVRSSDWVGMVYYSLVLAWNTDAYHSSAPQNWADFWDFAKFPGTRSLFQYGGIYSLEIALLADGVAPDKVYPIDVERAMRKLKEMKPHVTAWWLSGAQSQQLLANGDADMIGIWNGRPQLIMDQGGKANYTFNQQLLDFDCMVVPKGAPHKQLAMKAVAKFISAPYQARLPQLITYGPVNTKAFDSLSPELKAKLPSSPENRAKALIIDPVWWADNLEKMTDRFNEFLQK
jgi:putative spermidine/putrescine transport system substrate-binding protein